MQTLNNIDFEDSCCDIDSGISDEPSSSNCRSYTSYTHPSKLLNDKGKVSSTCLSIFVQGLKAKAKHQQVNNEISYTNLETPKINHFYFNALPLYYNQGCRRRGKSLFAKPRNQRKSKPKVKKNQIKPKVRGSLAINTKAICFTPPISNLFEWDNSL